MRFVKGMSRLDLIIINKLFKNMHQGNAIVSKLQINVKKN